jgi:hypothetical protein
VNGPSRDSGRGPMKTGTTSAVEIVPISKFKVGNVEGSGAKTTINLTQFLVLRLTPDYEDEICNGLHRGRCYR